jgi:hypothetical protein
MSLSDPENGDSTFLQNVSGILPEYKMLHPTKQFRFEWNLIWIFPVMILFVIGIEPSDPGA